jgi:hypothetical protein
MKAYPKGAPDISAAAKIAAAHMGRLAYGPNRSSQARWGVNTGSDSVNAIESVGRTYTENYGQTWCDRRNPRPHVTMPTTLVDKTCNYQLSTPVALVCLCGDGYQERNFFSRLVILVRSRRSREKQLLGTASVFAWHGCCSDVRRAAV